MFLVNLDSEQKDSLNWKGKWLDTESSNVQDFLKTLEVNQHRSYLSIVGTKIKPSLSIESSNEMCHSHVPPQFESKTSCSIVNSSVGKCKTVVSRPKLTSAKSYQGQNHISTKNVPPLQIDDWGEEAEVVVNGSESLRCKMSMPLLNLEEDVLMSKFKPKSKAKSISVSSMPPRLRRRKTMPELFRSTRSYNWSPRRIAKESKAMREELNNMVLDLVKSESTCSQDSLSSVKTCVSIEYDDEGEIVSMVSDQCNKSNKVNLQSA